MRNASPQLPTSHISESAHIQEERDAHASRHRSQITYRPLWPSPDEDVEKTATLLASALSPDTYANIPLFFNFAGTVTITFVFR